MYIVDAGSNQDSTQSGGSSRLFFPFNYLLSHKRISVEIAGAFTCIGFFTAIGAGANPVQPHDTPSAPSPSPSHSIETLKSVQPTSSVSLQTSTSDTRVNPPPPSSDSSKSTSSSSATVTINGQNVAVPANGSVQRTITSPDGTTTLDVSSSNKSSGTGGSSSSVDLNVSSTNTSTTASDDNTLMNGAPIYQNTP